MSVDFQNDLLLLTCASGKQCAHLIPLVSQKFKRLRLQVNSQASLDRLREQYPYAEVVQADLGDPHAVSKLVSGATALYLVGPSLHPRETDVCKNVVDSAVQEFENGRGGFKHFLYSSVLNTQLSKLLNHDCKRYVEEYLMESGLPYTIMQPTHFMDTFPVASLAQQESPVWPAPWDPKVQFCFIALKDLAAASAIVLEQREKHMYAQYPLVSAGPHSYEDVIAITGKEMGKAIRIEKTSYEGAIASRVKMLFGTEDCDPGMKDIMERLILYYERRGLLGNSNQLEWLLGRKPTSYAEWVRGNL
ncbi:NAD(P)-binding protein [Viridothelium virens]|uniref:NAD(P)-binding protein n=1 Tax=Viridothelium virens TaxID=1048519 RepID=A0A6A6HP97_VIRVR|nr:NAD(P)-binding protein [Viridothelium virens]